MQWVVRDVVDRAHDPAPGTEVEHVDARRRLLEVAEVRAAARECMRDQDAVDAAVEHSERRLPLLCDEPLECRQNSVERLAERLAAEESRLLIAGVQRADEERLELVNRNVVEAAATPLGELRPLRRRLAGRNDGTVSTVRGSVLVITMSNSTSTSAPCAAAACSRPRSVRRTVSGSRSPTYDTSACRIR